jgi:glycosyltransferase involved in cell wall biosynthesis
MTIALNGRFTQQPLTGVQRYAREISSRLADRLRLVAPASKAQGLRGHLWEQFRLPWLVGGELVWSPGNTGPLSYKRQVVTIHDCAVFDRPEGFSSKFAQWYRWMLPRLARNVRRVVTVSEYSRERIMHHCRVSADKVVTIPNGVDAKFHRVNETKQQQAREKLQLPERFILCVGSLEPRKNLGRLLSAWQSVPHLHSEWSLVLVGGNDHVYRGIGFDSPPPSVKMLGRVDDEWLPAIYSAAGMFVYPSLYEGFGLTVLEAMACGTPVICSSTTSLPEVAGEAAVLIDPENVNDLASAIADLAGDPVRRGELQQAGLARSSQFSWDTAAEKTWQVLSAARDE